MSELLTRDHPEGGGADEPIGDGGGLPEGGGIDDVARAERHPVSRRQRLAVDAAEPRRRERAGAAQHAINGDATVDGEIAAAAADGMAHPDHVTRRHQERPARRKPGKLPPRDCHDRGRLQPDVRTQERDLERCGILAIADEQVRQPQRHGVGRARQRYPGRTVSGSAEILNRGEQSGLDHRE